MTTQQSETNCWYVQHGWTSTAPCTAKEARHEGYMYICQLTCLRNSGKGKTTVTKYISHCLGARRGYLPMSTGELSGVTEMLRICTALVVTNCIQFKKLGGFERVRKKDRRMIKRLFRKYRWKETDLGRKYGKKHVSSCPTALRERMEKIYMRKQSNNEKHQRKMQTPGL